MVTEGDHLDTKTALLTAPFSLDHEDKSSSSSSSDSDSKYRAPNIIQRILGLLSTIRPGSDLNRLQLPPVFNIPKSQLQCYGESVYSISTDLLSKCNHQETPLDRFLSVVAWNISALRPLAFGLAPYNPILGETHHISRGTLNVLLEQVSHHPPVAVLHATDDKENIETLWCHSLASRFYGTHIETEVQGKRQLKLLDRNETYTMNSPNLVIRLLPVPRVDWIGNVGILCQETDLEAELSYRGNSFLPRPSMHRSIKGKIFKSSTSKVIYEISGHWDKTINAKDVSTGKTTVIYDAKEALSGLKTPVVTDPKAISPSESTVVWAEVSRAIIEKSWEKAREAKSCVEETQRELARERKSVKEDWSPKHFKVSHSNESGWECVPIRKWVPPAPIVVDP